jgi:excisionase family DNA binding protein
VLHDFLTVREVAARGKVSTATVYKLCAGGQLPYVRVLGSIRIAPRGDGVPCKEVESAKLS